ncbi:MAG: S1 RNA-binding domain-containing protein [Candidatus Woesearchaeota archaeon]|jgi:translation initiation factor 2 subunit 1
MFFKKQGFPEEGDLVFATVTNVQYNSVFCQIEEYGRQGLIHISEVNPGRIRNIRDFVVEGKMIVCKVIKLDKEKGHIDLSLRRVTEMQKRQKTDERKQEQKAEKIIETLASQVNLPVQQVYDAVATPLIPKYEMLQYAFQDVVETNMSLEKAGVPKEYADKLDILVREKLKERSVLISGTISLKSYEENGVDVVKLALIDALKIEKKVSIKYLGAGLYALEIEAKEYKDAEKILKDVLDSIQKSIGKNKNTEFSFKKKEKKDKKDKKE